MSRKPVLSLVAFVALAACSGGSGTPSAPASVPVTPGATQTPTPAATAKPAATAATPMRFTSLLYGYSITVPAGWNVGAAMLRWDGASAPGHDDASVDKFVSPSTLSAWGMSGPATGDIDRYVKDNIAWTVRDHGDTCPATAPEATEAIQIGGEAGVLLSWNCGILINEALLVRRGIGFVFVMRDPNVNAAIDPADRVIFEALLDSVILPS